MRIAVKVENRTPELMQKLESAIGRFVVKGAGYVEGQLKRSMAEPKSGRRYPRGKQSYHIASAPGESPAVDSGNLTGSIAIESLGLEARVGTAVKYAPYLETGTSRMAARPLWETEATKALPTLEKMLQTEIGA